LNFLVWHEWSLAGFFFVLLAFAFLNLRGFPRLPKRMPKETPKVSVLVPVRDEAENIGECLSSLFRQDYPDYEVLVYEEGSKDGTKDILSALADPRLRVIFGDGPPPGWLGKPWACAKLAEMAKGELLLFLDADVRLSPKAVTSAVAALERENLDLLSLLPQQEVPSLGVALHVALIPWSLSSFFPLFVPKLRRVAVGQFLLIRRSAYEKIGGHGALRAEVLEDQALAARAAKARLRLKLFFSGDLARCRMYRSFWEANRGLAKNLFPIFKKRLLPFAFVWTWLLYVAWQPLFVLPLALFGVVPPELVRPAAWALGSAFSLWAFTTLRFRLPLWLPLTFPFVHLVAWFTAARSAFWHLAGRGTWKGRSIHVKGGKP
jgi:chlorobactene glucosyltransferase